MVHLFISDWFLNRYLLLYFAKTLILHPEVKTFLILCKIVIPIVDRWHPNRDIIRNRVKTHRMKKKRLVFFFLSVESKSHHISAKLSMHFANSCLWYYLNGKVLSILVEKKKERECGSNIFYLDNVSIYTFEWNCRHTMHR